MSDDFHLYGVEPKATSLVMTATQVATGIPIAPVRLLQVMSAEDWEQFTEEWLSFHKANGTYQVIKRFSGPGDFFWLFYQPNILVEFDSHLRRNHFINQYGEA